jgi:hypothetical protein
MGVVGGGGTEPLELTGTTLNTRLGIEHNRRKLLFSSRLIERVLREVESNQPPFLIQFLDEPFIRRIQSIYRRKEIRRELFKGRE